MQTEAAQLAGYIVWLPLVFAVVVVGASSITLRLRGFSFGGHLGAATWDFSESWASTLTGAGAVVNSILSAELVGDEAKHLPKETYATLAVLFAAFIVIAPLIYNFIRSSEVVHPDPKDPQKTDYQYQGYAGVFLIASTMTLWGALGEIATTVLLFDEIRLAGFISGPPVRLFQAILGIVTLLLLVYASRTTYRTVQQQVAKREADRRYFAPLGPEAEQLKTPLPAWPLL